ncbi:MAG: sn-glycerol-3-phosphate ABC transporter ATP-binding protein UgpC [Oscillospiraceae bacterium]|nr:sn-glycerol-3-phosphate ABC transporter ATP-binding protein UgpC [Oscillospiraceae bacterium]
MSSVTLKHVSKLYPSGIKAVDDFSMEIEDKEFIVLVGPSGCGKSTTLRMIAGLEEITEGELYIDGKLMNQVQPKDRDIAMVFQNYALYPHMTVFENISFGLRMRHMPRAEIRKRVENAARILELSELLDRKPGALSGGQRQRVALGRAIVRDPKVFLLDEPLSNLDAKLRTAMRAEIAKLHKQLGTTFVYVTHDQTEAMTMGTRIVVMRDGVIQQISPPQELFDKPCNLFVATFIGTPQMNIIRAQLREQGEGIAVQFGTEGDEVCIPLPESKASIPAVRAFAGKEVLLGIRPNDVYPSEDGFAGRVEMSENQGAERNFYLRAGGASIMTQVSNRDFPAVPETLRVSFNMDMAYLFDPESEKTLTV